MTTPIDKLERDKILLSISESARLFGLHEQTIRKAVKRKELASVVVRGRYKINFYDVLAWSQKNAWRSNHLQRDGIGQFVGKWHIK